MPRRISIYIVHFASSQPADFMYRLFRAAGDGELLTKAKKYAKYIYGNVGDPMYHVKQFALVTSLGVERMFGPPVSSIEFRVLREEADNLLVERYEEEMPNGMPTWVDGDPSRL